MKHMCSQAYNPSIKGGVKDVGYGEYDSRESSRPM